MSVVATEEAHQPVAEVPGNGQVWGGMQASLGDLRDAVRSVRIERPEVHHHYHANNGREPDDEPAVEEVPGEGTTLSACYQCKKLITRDYSDKGVGISYINCCNKDNSFAVHQTCGDEVVANSSGSAPIPFPPCTKCGARVTLSPASRAAILFLKWLIAWPWWALTRAWPALILCGFLAKIFWMTGLVFGSVKVDVRCNPWTEPIALAAAQTGVLTRLKYSDFYRYHFCHYSKLDLHAVTYNLWVGALVLSGYYKAEQASSYYIKPLQPISFSSIGFNFWELGHSMIGLRAFVYLWIAYKVLTWLYNRFQGSRKKGRYAKFTIARKGGVERVGGVRRNKK